MDDDEFKKRVRMARSKATRAKNYASVPVLKLEEKLRRKQLAKDAQNELRDLLLSRFKD